jgi:PPOX class probable F420-dependent enzyme
LADADRFVDLIERLAVGTGLQERGLVTEFGRTVAQGREHQMRFAAMKAAAFEGRSRLDQQHRLIGCVQEMRPELIGETPAPSVNTHTVCHTLAWGIRITVDMHCGSGSAMTDALSALGAEKFVSLTTFKKDGTPVAAPMWIGRDGDHLFVWTPADSWKAKRAKNNPRVVLVPCSRGGKVRDGAEPVDGIAEVITEPATVQRLAGVIRRKYGLEFTVVTFIERVVARGQKPRLVLSIALSS